MRLQRTLREANRGWLWGGLACLAVTMSAFACSQQSVPTSPSTGGLNSEAVHGHGGPHADEASPNVVSELAVVRQLTAKYHDLSAALADGYQLGYKGMVTGCVANPAFGAMGYHYFHQAKMDDPSIVATDPEVLVYHTSDDGTLVLGAVEWVVPRMAWEADGNTAAPVVFGTTMHVINFTLNWYIAHAWVWKHNPSGMFSDWNPEVTCP